MNAHLISSASDHSSDHFHFRFVMEELKSFPGLEESSSDGKGDQRDFHLDMTVFVVF